MNDHPGKRDEKGRHRRVISQPAAKVQRCACGKDPKCKHCFGTGIVTDRRR